MDGISGYSNSYRDQWASSLYDDLDEDKDKDKTEGTDETEDTGKVWDAVFTDKKDNGVSVNDFLSLMVAQLKNQDFMNPVDDTQYVTQLAQFATMQQMQEMATYMKTNYVMSLVGKNVTAAKFSVAGELQKETGAVQRISLVNNEYAVYVNGKKFTLEQIMEINSADPPKDDGTGEIDPDKADYLTSLVGRNVTIQQWDKDEDGNVKKDGTVSGVVDKVSMEDGQYRLCVDGEWYLLKDVIQVDKPAEPEDPDDSDDITDPDDPGDVTDPDNPGDVTDPENPGDVTNPNPDEVTDPENPGDTGAAGSGEESSGGETTDNI